MSARVGLIMGSGRISNLLLEFAGIATIRDDKGRHQDVRIVFPQPPAAADARALRDALATPLVGRCG